MLYASSGDSVGDARPFPKWTPWGIEEGVGAGHSEEEEWGKECGELGGFWGWDDGVVTYFIKIYIYILFNKKDIYILHTLKPLKTATT